MRVAYQGEPGAYSEAAAFAFEGHDIITVPVTTFDGVESGACDRAVVPVENSLAGSIHRNYDLLLTHKLYIIGEHNHRVSHCLIVNPGVRLEDVRRIYSHPQALAQCEGSLRALGSQVQVIASQDTAGSARILRDEGWRDVAALASEHAAELYGLEILWRGMEDDSSNYTRFLSLAREPLPLEMLPEPAECKTSIAFAGQNEPGLLYRCLSAFALRNVDLCKIESRPLRSVPWQYIFYIDFAGHVGELRCQRALDHLGEMTMLYRMFGSYPRSADNLKTRA
ncbi:MAG: prephenate dehydratase [Chloroflexi bacterium]|nr:prephenate dehydratase [Chloroflexota bacterium]